MKKFWIFMVTIMMALSIQQVSAFAADNPIDFVKETAEDYIPQMRTDDFKREFVSDDGLWKFKVTKKGDQYKIQASFTKKDLGTATDGAELSDLIITFNSTVWSKALEADLRVNGMNMSV